MFYLAGITVRKIASPAEYKQVLALREETTGIATRDPQDFAPNAALLIAYNTEGSVIGSLRILNRGKGAIELDAYAEVEKLVGGQSCAEATRLVATKAWERESVIFALYKAYFRYCMAHNIETALLSASEDLALTYPDLLLEHVKGRNLYKANPHHGVLERHTFLLDLAAYQQKMKNHQLLQAFLLQLSHRNISFS